MQIRAAKALLSVLIALDMISAGRVYAATAIWTNAAGGNWTTASNWQPNRVPGGFDTVLITADGTYTVVLDAGVELSSFTLGGTNGKQRLVVGVGQINISSPSVVESNGILE